MPLILRFRKLSAAVIVGALLVFAVSARAYQAEQVTDGGTITGIVKFRGTPPPRKLIEITKDVAVCGRDPHYDPSLMVGKSGGIENAVVALTDIQRGAPLIPKKVTFDQIQCEYVPHVLAFPAGSTVRVVNSDGILHNIRTSPKHNPAINIAQPGFKKTIDVTVKHPDVIRVSCDAHNWMEGWWYVAGNPYYAKTGADGRFTIKDVPPGTYKLKVWQEKLGTETRKVTVKAGATTVVDFTMGAKQG